MPRPRVTIRPVARQYDGPNQRTVEFEGGLIGIYRTEEGFIVSLYRLNDNVAVWIGGKIARAPGVATEEGSP